MKTVDWTPFVTLGPSPIHGIGVFARRPLTAQTTIGQLRLQALGSLGTFGSVPGTAIVSGGDCFAVAGGFPFWYLNYANSATVAADASGRVTVLVDLAAGDELTLRGVEGIE